jgi:hypothetical protein
VDQDAQQTTASGFLLSRLEYVSTAVSSTLARCGREEGPLRNAVLAAFFLCAVVLAGTSSHAQQFDAAFGFHGVTGPSASSADVDHQPQTIGGGVFPSFSADILPWGRLGVQGEVSWRYGQNLYQGFQPFRPIFFDFNGIWAPNFGDRAGAELLGGFGFQSTRFYTSNFSCSGFTGSCTNYVSSNHLMGHVGAGFRYYVTHNIFVRPEAHLYFVRNNFEFSGSRVNRFGVSVGYSWRPSY